jgi:hypothetical protein
VTTPRPRTRRRWVKPAALAAFLLAGVISCAVAFADVPNERPDLESILAAAAMESGLDRPVSLAEALTFPWDRVFIVGPYTPANIVRDCVGFDWSPRSPGQSALGLDALFMLSEGFSLLVFVQGARDVTGWSVLSPYEPPTVLFPSGGDGCREFSRGNARFQIDSPEPGVWTFVPA